MLVHRRAGSLRRGARNGHKFDVWKAVVCWLVKEAMSSLSSSGAVVSVPVLLFVVASIERRCSEPVAGGSVYETSEKPLLFRCYIRQDCSSHGCQASEEGYLNFVFPSALESFC